MSRSGPFCMHQLKNMFGTSRIAATDCDKVVTQWPCSTKHINVIYKDQIFSVQVIGPNGETVPIKTLEGYVTCCMFTLVYLVYFHKQTIASSCTTSRRNAG